MLNFLAMPPPCTLPLTVIWLEINPRGNYAKWALHDPKFNLTSLLFCPSSTSPDIFFHPTILCYEIHGLTLRFYLQAWLLAAHTPFFFCSISLYRFGLIEFHIYTNAISWTGLEPTAHNCPLRSQRGWMNPLISYIFLMSLSPHRRVLTQVAHFLLKL